MRRWLPGAHARRRRAVIITLSLMAGLLTLAGCGGKPPAAAGAGGTGTLSPSSPASPTPAASPALDPAKLVGKVLFALNDNHAACAAALNGTPPPGLPGGGGAASAAPGNATAAATNVGTLVPGGVLVLPCAASSSATSSWLVAFNLFTRTVAWKLNVSGYDAQEFGSQHLFLVSHTRTPPSGLQSGTTSYELTAVSLATGATSWTVPYFADNPHSGDQGIFALDEGPSGVPGHPDAVVLTYLGTSAYDARTGANLWHIKTEYETEANGSYVTDGVEEIYGYQDNLYDSHITGFDARTGRQLWNTRLTVPCVADTGAQTDVLAGTVEWEFGSGCVQAHDVATGKVVMDRAYPSSWKSTAATPSRVLEYGHSELALFRTSDLTHPVWSQKAGPATPLAVSSGHVLVQAPAGMLVLSATDGSITTSVPASLFNGNGDYTVVDGLVQQNAVDGQTSVLELDPPTSKP